MVNTENNKLLVKYRIYLPYLVIIFVILLWQLISETGIFLPTVFPSPFSVLQATYDLFINGNLINHIGASLMRVFIGFFLAAIIAIPLGFLLGWHPLLNYALNPLIQIIRPISPIAWIPIAILWFGIGNKPSIFIIWISTFFPILTSSVSAVKDIDPVIIKSAINLGANDKAIIKNIILPATFPSIVVGLRLALGIAWVIIVAAEMVGMRTGLGFLILDARNYLRVDMVVSGMIIVGVIGLLLDKITVNIENRIRAHWGFNIEK